MLKIGGQVMLPMAKNVNDMRCGDVVLVRPQHAVPAIRIQSRAVSLCVWAMLFPDHIHDHDPSICRSSESDHRSNCEADVTKGEKKREKKKEQREQRRANSIKPI